MRVWLGLIAGALCAIAIACGGAQKQSYTAAGPPAAGAREPIAAGPPGRELVAASRPDLAALDREIDDDLAKLGMTRPATPPGACIEPPCDVAPMSAPLGVSTSDPTCRPGPAETCKDSCRLSDAICNAAGKICRIATDLGGNDRYANDRCESGKASCDAAHGRCCGCT